jgi:hypothetical protein
VTYDDERTAAFIRTLAYFRAGLDDLVEAMRSHYDFDYEFLVYHARYGQEGALS